MGHLKNISSMTLQTYKLTIAYDGTNYCGWQVQPNGLTIQGVLENALKIYCREPIRLIGAGRTDSGVHAKGQVAHFRTEQILDPKHIQRALNGLLPLSIRIMNAELAEPTFHAQRSAHSKEYHYAIALGDVTLPFIQPYVWHQRKKLDLSILAQSTHLFIGKHNFSAFANSQESGAAGKNPFRTIFRLDCIQTDFGIRLEFEGDGFLYKMVRNITGMLVAVASGKRNMEEITMLLLGAPRCQAAKAAPPTGLTLIKVMY